MATRRKNSSRVNDNVRPVRRKARRRKGSRRGGRSFFIVMLLLLVGALVYYFEGDRVFQFFDLGGYATVVLGNDQILVSFLDVGQGDSILVRSRDHAILIDGGEHSQRNVVLNYLRGAGIDYLDYVVATHPHSDHIGGLITVLRQVGVGRLVMPDVEHNTSTFENFLAAIENNNIPVMFPVAGDRIHAGIIDMIVLTPFVGAQANLNNNSIVLRLVHENTSFLFTGDAERELEQAIVNSGWELSSNVLKIGHHGSRTSTTQEFFNAVDPVAVVISLGADNQFGHPHAEVMRRLETSGVRIYRTDEMGTIRMLTNGQTIDRFSGN